jgi:PBSX family phage terminase large subunit
LIGQGVDDRFYVMREYFHSGADGRQKTDSEYAKELKRFLPNHYENICIDPSAKSFILACKRINIDNIRKARNDVLDGIRSVSSLLSAGLLYYHKSCTNLINEKQAYSWDSKAQEKGEDKPIKDNDHACDAERYSLFSNMKYWKSILDYETEAVDRLEGAIVN